MRYTNRHFTYLLTYFTPAENLAPIYACRPTRKLRTVTFYRSYSLLVRWYLLYLSVQLLDSPVKAISPTEQPIGVKLCTMVSHLPRVLSYFGDDITRGLQNPNALSRKGAQVDNFWPLRHPFHPFDRDYLETVHRSVSHYGWLRSARREISKNVKFGTVPPGAPHQAKYNAVLSIFRV